MHVCVSMYMCVHASIHVSVHACMHVWRGGRGGEQGVLTHIHVYVHACLCLFAIPLLCHQR